MSILLLSEIFPPRHGGSGRWFYELYRRLEPGTVTIVTQDNADSADQRVDAEFPQRIHRTAMASPSWGLLSVTGLVFYARTLMRILRLKPSGLSQIHCGRTIPEGFIGLLLARLLRKPLLCYVHGEDIEVARTSRELTWIVNRVLRGADRLICNSQNTKSLLMEHWHVPAKKIEVINPGVDEQTFCPAESDPAFREKVGWDDRFVCLTVGRLQRRKGHDKMIEAIPHIKAEIPNILYAIVGQGDNYPNLVAEVKKLGLEQHVKFLDEIEDEDLIRCYQQCDVFILPNRSDGNDIEGFGMVLVEAQAAGKPVIAGNSGGTAETMKVGNTGMIVDCTSPEAIAKAVNSLKEEMEQGAFQPDACRQHVLENLTWVKHTEKAKAVFQQHGGGL
ncbi:phosphatidylinositol alpha-1,6-mannosyltransferase [Marinobacter sp. DSM 26671]|uniref:glycosyltransferase family 4 protein n=1 Tax=Marinobacter sp. DSM 26671 TaxID=1761793 RepID=UPI0008E3F829|nr:glycosyltransferase family 4 protein [Marinobacter sp. DSM 26671]SFD90834.1 phosphatidylinositol alpha-1,6-mannosyltransferase [Marinobacter sp. DSM 26671]